MSLHKQRTAHHVSNRCLKQIDKTESEPYLSNRKYIKCQKLKSGNETDETTNWTSMIRKGIFTSIVNETLTVSSVHISW